MATVAKAKRRARKQDEPFKVGDMVSGRIDTDRLADALTRHFASHRPAPSLSSAVCYALELLMKEKDFWDNDNGRGLADR